MATTANTPLAYIMDILCITGTDLAREIHIDRSMVSRWKNGTVALTARSPYFNEIIKALMVLNQKQGYNALENFLEGLSNQPLQSESAVRKQLARWLSGNDFSKIQKKDSGSILQPTYKIYPGSTGKKEALSYFLQKLQSLPSGESATLYDTSIYTNENNATKSFQNQLLKVTDTRLTVLSFLNRSQDEIHRFQNFWLPICFRNHVQLLYTYDPTPPLFDFMYLIRGKLVVLGNSGKNREQYTAVFEDPYTLRQIEEHLEKLKEKFSPMLSCHSGLFDSISESDISHYMKNDNPQYIFLEGCPFLPVDKKNQDFFSFLQPNHEEDKLLKRYLRQCQQLYGQMQNNPSRFVLDLPALQSLSFQTEVEVPALTRLLGRPVLLPTTIVLQNLSSLVQGVMANPGIEISFRPAGCSPFLPNTNCWLKQDSFSHFHGTEPKSKHVVVDEFTSMRANYNIADQYWNSLPKESKDKRYIQDQLQALDTKLNFMEDAALLVE